jgi:hypothetical protein
MIAPYTEKVYDVINKNRLTSHEDFMGHSHTAALWVADRIPLPDLVVELPGSAGERQLEVFSHSRARATVAVLSLDAIEALQWNTTFLDGMAQRLASHLHRPVYALVASFGTSNHFSVTAVGADGAVRWHDKEKQRLTPGHRALARRLGIEAGWPDDDDDDLDRPRVTPANAAYWRFFHECYGTTKPIDLIEFGLKPAMDFELIDGWKRVGGERRSVTKKATVTRPTAKKVAKPAARVRLYSLGHLDWEPRPWAHFERLVKKGLNVRRRTSSGETLLHGDIDPRAIGVLAKAGVNPNVPNQAGNTPLAVAVGYLEANAVARVKALLAAGADPFVRYNGLDLLKQLDLHRSERGKKDPGVRARANEVERLLERRRARLVPKATPHPLDTRPA